MNKQKFEKLAWDILESMPDFVAVDTDGIITYINRKYAAWYGLTQDECIGRPVEEIVPGTRMKEMAQLGKEGKEKSLQLAFAARTGAVRNRLIVYQDGERSPANAVGAMAFEIGGLDADKQELLRIMEQLRRQNDMYQSHLAQMYKANRELDEILGESPNVQSMKELIQRVADTLVSVNIHGETGTGKELVANAIHKLSSRADKPFVKINCAAIPKDLIESELFGYDPGAFTGASRQGKVGKFELANGGTLLLDEISELPLNLQAKLLRVLQAREVEHIGGTSPIPIDVRLICSSNQDLYQMVEDRLFRSDLYYRINTMEIIVPSLRDRVADIPILAAHFIKTANQKNNLSVTGISDRALHVLLSYQWPGNIRELEHSIERACVLCGNGQLDVEHFSSLFAHSRAPASPLSRSLRLREDECNERKLILEALSLCRGNRSAAAKQLNIARSTLYMKLEKYGIG